MDNLIKLDYIDKHKKVDVVVEKTLSQMIKELNEEQKLYREESKIYHKKMDEQLVEIRSTLKYILTEQEKQRISQMSMSELLLEIQNNINDMSSIINKVGVI